MQWKRLVVETLIIGLGQWAVGVGASWTVSRLDTLPWLKGVGVIAIWLALIVAGTVLLIKHPWRKSEALADESPAVVQPPPVAFCDRVHITLDQQELLASATENVCLADTLRAMVSHGRALLPRGIVVRNVNIVFAGLNADLDPYIDFQIRICNGTSFRLNIGQNISGEHVGFQGHPLQRLLEVVGPQGGIRNMDSTDEDTLTVRQWLSNDAAKAIAFNRGKEVVFLFADVLIAVDALAPSGLPGGNCRLPVPEKVSGIVPELQSGRQWMGMQTGRAG